MADMDFSKESRGALKNGFFKGLNAPTRLFSTLSFPEEREPVAYLDLHENIPERSFMDDLNAVTNDLVKTIVSHK